MKKKNKWTIYILIVFFVIIILGIMSYKSGLKPLSNAEDEKIIKVEVAAGSNMNDIASLLKEKDVIKNELVFRLYSKLNHLEDKYKAGVYDIYTTMDLEEIAALLQSGKGFTDTARFTIPEGFEIRMIIDNLVEKGLGTKEELYEAINNGEYDYDFLEGISREEGKLEGYLFPDTYEVYGNASGKEIIKKMLNRFDDVFNDEYRKRVEELGMSIDELITLASIIEREAKVDEERKIISSVFHNRLKNRMMLQSCATVQYVLKERKEILLFKDLEVQSPYNTYKNFGLPPGPIASPGLKSIEAALYPDNTDYLYFVAKDDGTHVFTKTFKEHIEAQNKINNNR